jgi:hypothetical protein
MGAQKYIQMAEKHTLSSLSCAEAMQHAETIIICARVPQIIECD